MTALDERRKRLLLLTFRHLDKTLSEVDRLADGKGIPIDVRSVETISTIHTYLIFMDISAEEIRPKYMRGYGELTREAAYECIAE